MNVAGIMEKCSNVIAVMLIAVVAVCTKTKMLARIDCIRTGSTYRSASLAITITLTLPSCAIFAESLYVANSGNSTLSKFDASGQHLSTLWNPGPGYVSYFNSPSALAFDSQGNLYVANSGNSTLSKFDASGQHLSTLWNPGPGYVSYFNSPSALAFDSQGNLYVANSGNSTLSKFDASGQHLSTLWNPGPGYVSYFNSPSALAFDSQGNLYVANSGNSTLSKFDASGQHLSTLWNPGPGYVSYFNSPSALAFDSQGNLYVANSGNSTLSKFDASGQHLSTLWNPGPGYVSYFNSPSAIIIRAVPEPSTCDMAMALAGLACGGHLVRRWRKQTCREPSNVIPTRGKHFAITGMLTTLVFGPLSSSPAPAPPFAPDYRESAPDLVNTTPPDPPTNTFPKPTALDP
jgi:DNA-binding beta-propeller fold protein YncE